MPPSVVTDMDYPSILSRGLAPPNPVLLDTCVIQHLSYVASVVDWDAWTDGAVDEVVRRLGQRLATEVLALMAVVQEFSNSGQLVWAASQTAERELSQAHGPRGARLQRQWQDLHHWWEAMLTEWPQELACTIEPIPHRVSADQLEMPLGPVPQAAPVGATPFGPFLDEGDRALILEARRRGFRAILTTDLKSFWRHRHWLFPVLEVWRPSDILRSFGGRPEALVQPIG